MKEQKDPFEFYDSPWWKDMNKQLCVDGWPQVVVAINCMVRDAKKAHEDLKQNSVPMDVVLNLVEALHFQDQTIRNLAIEEFEQWQKGRG